MYNRENIDPRHLGLHVHHMSVKMLKTLQVIYGRLDLMSEGLVLDLKWVNCGFWLSVRGWCATLAL